MGVECPSYAMNNDSYLKYMGWGGGRRYKNIQIQTSRTHKIKAIAQQLHKSNDFVLLPAYKICSSLPTPIMCTKTHCLLVNSTPIHQFTYLTHIHILES